MVESLGESIRTLASWVWSYPMLIVLFFTGIYFTIRLKGIQIVAFLKSAKLTYTTRVGKGKGNISPLQSLFGALGGMIGNGNIAGAATAVFMGGPGALLWMWIGAFIGMVIVFVETLLALMYRQKDKDGNYNGGPMYYIQKVLKLRWLAVVFALAMGLKTLFGTSLVQSNSISLAASSIIDMSWLPAWMPVQLPFCFLLAFLTWMVIIGGLKVIAKVLEKITPSMVILYLLLVIIIIVSKYNLLIDVLMLVWKNAFTASSATGGFAGATVMMVVRYGIARGFYSNEAGTGSSPIMYSAAKVDNIYHQSLVGMFGVFIDTVISSATILAILITGVWTSGLTSTALTTAAFNVSFGNYGGVLILLSSFLFGYSTLIAWGFYGEQCFAFIWGSKIRKLFRWVFSLVILMGFLKVETIWSIADLLNATLIMINIIVLIFILKYVLIRVKSFHAIKK